MVNRRILIVQLRSAVLASLARLWSQSAAPGIVHATTARIDGAAVSCYPLNIRLVR
jgi:hypothetical protein